MTDHALSVQPLPWLRANNDGAKISPEGDVTDEEGKGEGDRRTVAVGRGCRVRSFRPTFQTEWLLIVAGFVTN